ncbi:MAG: MotA/TolQ/ExbB proton channel family protein [Phycisphaerales bacterium]|nr:MotA/TolQ/ExbB proton channel family protein [Phycisphaerales bacterium]
MDIATIIGTVMGMGLIVLAMILGGSPGAYIDPISMIIVIGGATAAVFASFPLNRILSLPKVCLKTVFVKSTNPNDLVQELVGYAEVARRDGILSLEGHTEEMSDDFIAQGIRMAVDGTDPELIRQIMETELENLMDRHREGKAILEALGRYAPAFGMIGTLVGLVAMLANMDDPSKIGSGMAAALITTLYGAVVANVLFLPLADKLGLYDAEETLLKSMVLEGVMSIQSGDNPRVVEQKLMTYLPPSKRVESGEEEAAAA